MQLRSAPVLELHTLADSEPGKTAATDQIWYARQCHAVLNYAGITTAASIKQALLRALKKQFPVRRPDSPSRWQVEDLDGKIAETFSQIFLGTQKGNRGNVRTGLRPSESTLFLRCDPVALIIASRVTHGDIVHLLDEASMLDTSWQQIDWLVSEENPSDKAGRLYPDTYELNHRKRACVRVGPRERRTEPTETPLSAQCALPLHI